MQKHIGAMNSTGQQSKNRNALEVLIREMGMSDREKARLLEDLRKLNLSDDNDPVVKITLIQGLFARYTGELFDRISSERNRIENAVVKNQSIAERFSNDLDDFKGNIKVWKDDSVIELERGIRKLKLDKEKLEIQNSSLHDNWIFYMALWVIFCIVANFVIFVVSWLIHR